MNIELFIEVLLSCPNTCLLLLEFMIRSTKMTSKVSCWSTNSLGCSVLFSLGRQTPYKLLNRFPLLKGYFTSMTVKSENSSAKGYELWLVVERGGLVSLRGLGQVGLIRHPGQVVTWSWSQLADDQPSVSSTTIGLLTWRKIGLGRVGGKHYKTTNSASFERSQVEKLSPDLIYFPNPLQAMSRTSAANPGNSLLIFRSC